MTSSSKSECDVTIIGAGPVGLYTALLLAKEGISVHVFEKEAAVLQSPRAIVHIPVIVEEFRRTGVFQDIVDVGHVSRTGLQWRRPKSKEELASLPGDDRATTILLGQHDLADVFIRRLKEFDHVKVDFSVALETFEDLGGEVKCHLSRSNQGSTFEHRTKYLLGADGARSTVRKVASIPFEGFAWEDFRMIAANIDYDVRKYNGWGDANFICDPELWAIIVYCGKGTTWRVASAERIVDGNADEWDEEAAIKRLYERLGKLLNGPTDTAKVLAIAPYSLHQRCAATFAKNRVLLAGDAAHITNPVGALGLVTGLLDSAYLSRCLQRILIEKTPDPASVLAEYSEKRRKVFLENTSPTATANRNRLIGATDESRKERAEFFDNINRLDGEFMREYVGNQIAMASV